MTSTNPAPERGEITADDVTDTPEDIAVRTGAPPELLANSIGEYLRLWVKQLRSGESGALPVIIGLIVIVIFFQIKSSAFLSAGNLVNLMTQAAFIITLGMAEVFVLLLGEIDLAAGFTAACGAVIALYLVAKNYPWWVAVLACLAATGLYGALQGFLVTRLRLPSFVVSLAGVVVVLVGNTNRGLLLPVRGLPWVVLVVLAVLVVYTTLLGRTRFGRYIYAIGGNAEAARRAGVNTNRIKVAAFALCGLTAGITGIIYSSYLGSISSGVNGGANVLNAVAAAVIGGTSLFGGRGKMLDAVLGGLVVGVIANGLQLLGLTAPAQLMWTALVLVGAVTVDALTRRGRSTV